MKLCVKRLSSLLSDLCLCLRGGIRAGDTFNGCPDSLFK